MKLEAERFENLREIGNLLHPSVPISNDEVGGSATASRRLVSPLSAGKGGGVGTPGSTGAGPGVPIRLLSGLGRSRVCRSVGDPQPGDWGAAAVRPSDPTYSHFPFPTRWKP